MTGDAWLPAGIDSPWLPGFTIWQDDEYLEGALRELDSEPEGLIIHSGHRNEGVADYTTNEGDDRRVSCHAAWSKRHQDFVLTVPLTHRASHAGAWNCWYGLALPGPYDQDPRDAGQHEAFRRLIWTWCAVKPGLRFWTRHSIVSDTRHDPGPGFKDSWMEGTGLELWTPTRQTNRT